MLAISAHGSQQRGVVTLDGTEVATVRALRSEASPDWKIHRLAEMLEVYRSNWTLVNPKAPFPGELLVFADRATDFTVIKKVLYTVGLAGYRRPSFVVRRKTQARQ